MKEKTIHISAELHKKLKIEAIKNNIQLKELVDLKLKYPLVQGEKK